MTTPRFSDEIRLVATKPAISCSRLFVECMLRHWGAGFLVDDAVREVDELVTSAVKATGTMDEPVRWTGVTHMEFITVRVFGFESSVRIEVWDSAPNPPTFSDEPGAAIKRGCYPTVRGKVVWAELPVLPPRRRPNPHPRSDDKLEQTEPGPELLRRVRDGLEKL